MKCISDNLRHMYISSSVLSSQVSTALRKKMESGKSESDFPRDQWRVKVMAERLDFRVFYDVVTQLFDPDVSIPSQHLPELFTEALATGDVKG